MLIPLSQPSSAKNNSRRHTTSPAAAHCAPRVKYLSRRDPLIYEKQCSVRRNVVGFVAYQPKVRSSSETSAFSSIIIHYLTDDTLVRCNTCHSAIKDTDVVLDAVRVGQEGLDKAEALQFSSMLSKIYSCPN